MEYDKFGKEKKLLSPHLEIQINHAKILDHHFTSIDLEKIDETIPTAFLTPNDVYKEKINGIVKDKKMNKENIEL